MLSESELKTYDNMRQYGGGFVKALAECWLRADPTNKATLDTAFSHYFDEYAIQFGDASNG